MANSTVPDDFESIKARLEEIANAVGDDSISLDDALDLYEEAVSLGMRVSDTIEDNIYVDDRAIDALDENTASVGETADAGADPHDEGANGSSD